jgi:hypothetical protein
MWQPERRVHQMSTAAKPAIALDGTELKPISGDYIHGVDLNNGYQCRNLSLSGKLFSPDYVAAVDAGVHECHRSIRDTDIALIEKGHVPPGAYTPRRLWFIQAAAQIRVGAFKEWSAVSASHFSDLEAENISKMGAVELAFERRRREVAPDAVSRVSCLYLADDDEFGHRHLRRMLGSKFHIIKVRIPLAIRLTKCDTAWFDEYWHKADSQYADNYWKGVARDPAKPTWEYLLDGMIQANDPEGTAGRRLWIARCERLQSIPVGNAAAL